MMPRRPGVLNQTPRTRYFLDYSLLAVCRAIRLVLFVVIITAHFETGGIAAMIIGEYFHYCSRYAMVSWLLQSLRRIKGVCTTFTDKLPQKRGEFWLLAICMFLPLPAALAYDEEKTDRYK